MKNPYTINTKNICVTIPMETNDYIEKFILDNAYMYNKIRNDFVEEANKYKGEYNMYDEFDPWKFRAKYYHNIEVPEHRYDYYCTGLSEQVANNFIQSRSAIRTVNRKIFNHESTDNLSEYKFKRFDYNRYTFRVRLKENISDNGKVRGRLKIISKNKLSFTIRTNLHNATCNRDKEEIQINLKENLYDYKIAKGKNPIFSKYYSANGITNECSFYLTDIKDICFKYECGKYYVLLFIVATYMINNESRKSLKYCVAGIDTGIRHPITIYDGKNTYYISMDEKTVRKIHYLERRIGRLNRVLRYKMEYNKANGINIYSNNVMKVIRKIKRLYRKITNIKIHWSRNIAKKIVTSYSTIVVDTFTQPDNKSVENIPKKNIKLMNYSNRFHQMYYTNAFIKHAAYKYGCEYIESQKGTTRTCSVCGHINDHIPLSQKNLICKKCGNVIERDENAAKNCYNYALSIL